MMFGDFTVIADKIGPYITNRKILVRLTKTNGEVIEQWVDTHLSPYAYSTLWISELLNRRSDEVYHIAKTFRPPIPQWVYDGINMPESIRTLLYGNEEEAYALA